MSAELLSNCHRVLALLVLVAVPLAALRLRGRTYAIFSGVILLFALPPALIVEYWLTRVAPAPLAPWIAAAFAYSVATAGVHLASLTAARLRARPFRALVSVPGQIYVAAGMMCLPWLLILLPFLLLCWLLDWPTGIMLLGWLSAAPFGLGLLSILTSYRPSFEVVRFELANEGPEEFRRMPVTRHRGLEAAPLAERPLRIVQITDPHLGPWQSVDALRRTIDALLETAPDLVLLTGDFLTMEGMGSPGALEDALSPLRRLPGRCYAIFGNHDHELPDEVRSALRANGATLLVDEATVAQTEVGPVQIVGSDYHRKDRREKLAELLDAHPRQDGQLRLLLLHDPLGFHDVPAGEVDLTLSGHTHGGQVGLVSFGSDWTVLSRTRWPDHGLFGHGGSRLYVHRGTGFYGFPLRVGVPGEHSLLEVVLPHAPGA
ncbi:MAG: metallophosphoesterase [Deltaproteobacteria bacterium]|nr:metallophosphoesterase [Deltaproteobacteria bacterium]